MSSTRDRLFRALSTVAKSAAVALASSVSAPNTGNFLRTPVKPRQSQGRSGTAVHGGYISGNETNSALMGRTKYETFDNMMANFSIVTGSVRYYQSLVARPTWAFEPPPDTGAEGEKYALLTEKALLTSATIPWHHVVRRAATYKLYGFSIQEWVARRREGEDFLGLDLEARPQRTIERFDVLETGKILGFGQRSPWDGREYYLNRNKVMYMVDDSLTDSPEGLGLLRQVVAAATRLQRYEVLEGFGYETELKGMPIGRAPLGYLNELVESGDLTLAEAEALISPLKNIVQNHIRTPELGILLDSMVYQSEGEQSIPSTNKMYDLDIIKGEVTANGQKNVADAIRRLNWEIARVFGTESLLLGSDGKGTYALSEDKTNNLLMLVDGVLLDIASQVTTDVIPWLFKLNGWPLKFRPRPVTDSSQYRNVKEITAALLDIAKAGVMLDPADKAIPVIYRALGLPRPPDINRAAEAALALQEAEVEGTKATAEATLNPPAAPAPKGGDKPGAAAPAAKKPVGTQKEG